jgi:CRP-like cAMP-binding protein
MSRASSPIAFPASAASYPPANSPVPLPSFEPEVAHVISRLGRRRTIKAGARVVEAGNEARFYHIVESGALAVLDPLDGAERPVAFLAAGDMFSLDCGAEVALTCVALFPSVVIALDRRRLDAAAREVPALADLIRDTHAAELSRILECTQRRRRARTAEPHVWEVAAAAKKRFVACARAVERGSRMSGALRATGPHTRAGGFPIALADRTGAGTYGH